MAARGRRLLRLGRGAFGGGWCWRIGVRGGVFLGSGSVFSCVGGGVWDCGLTVQEISR